MSPKTLILAQALISCMMAFLMTGFMGFLHLGLTEAWLHDWISNFVIAWPVAFCFSLVVGRIAFKLAFAMTGPSKKA
ncbi:DUF2798 domain-containing protein [Ochrobactrum teleogrylli]